MPYYLLLTTFVLEYVGLKFFIPFVVTAKLHVVIPLLTFVLSLFVKSRISHEDIWKQANTKWLVFLLFFILLSVATVGGIGSGEIFQGVLGYCFLYYAIIRLADTKAKLKGIFFVLTGCHVALIAINPKIILEPETRNYITGAPFLGDGNDFALSLVIVFPLVLYLFKDTKSKYFRLITITLAIFTVLSAIGTQSRGASLGLGAIMGFLWLKSKSKILGLFAIGVMLFGVVLFAAPQYFSRMATLSNYEQEGSAMGRIEAWGASMSFAASNPLLGVGVDNFGVYNHNKTAHSIYFLALGELGLPGFIFIVVYILGNLRRISRYLKRSSTDGDGDPSYENLFICLYCSMLGLGVTGAFLSCLYYPHIYVVGALIVAAQRLYDLDEKERESKGDSDQNEKEDPVNTKKPNQLGYKY